MSCRFRLTLLTLLAFATPLAFAADVVEGAIASSSLTPPLVETRLTHGFAVLDKVAARNGEYRLKVILADRSLADKLSEPADEPDLAFDTWLRQNQGDKKNPIAWARLTIDGTMASPSVDLGYGFVALGLSAENLRLTLSQADGKRVAGEFEVFHGESRGQVRFDVALLATDGIDVGVLERLASYPKAAGSADEGARSTYADFVRALREDRPADASGLRRDDVDMGPTGADSAGQSPWPEKVYASRVVFDPLEGGGVNWDYITARLAACRQREDGSAQRVLVTLWKYGADSAWVIAGQSEEDYDIEPLGPAPASCGAPKA